MSQRLHRISCWTAFTAIVGLDASIASPISLGLLYFVPLVAAGLLLSTRHVVVMAVVAAVARILFGPVGDPLGVQSLTYQLPERALPVANGVISAIAYATAMLVVLRLRQQEDRITRLGQEATRDPLTGVGNRRTLEALLGVLQGRLVSVLTVDLDHFKRVNDTHGHAVGDEVLRELAIRLRHAVRDGDVVVRTGGEEFVVVLPATSAEAATLAAGRVLESVRGAPFRTSRGELVVTASLGLASGRAGAELFERSDAALYEAKSTGRNRLVVAAEGPDGA